MKNMKLGLITGGLILVLLFSPLNSFAGISMDGLSVGDKAVDFTLHNIFNENEIFSLDNYTGKLLMVDLMATWCVPCHYAIPDMLQLYHDFSYTGMFDILTVDVDASETKTDIENFKNTYDIPWDITIDHLGAIGEGYFNDVYGSSGIPTFYLIWNNTIVYQDIGWHGPGLYSDLIMDYISLVPEDHSYSSYFGGGNADYEPSVAVDSMDNMVIFGSTFSEDIPVRNAAFAAPIGNSDLFLSKFHRDGTLLWSTYFGGTGDDYARKVIVDNQDNIIIVASTFSTDFPTKNAHTDTHVGDEDIALAKFATNGTLLFSTYHGGSVYDIPRDIATDSQRRITLIGTSPSPDYPLLNPIYSSSSGDTNVVLAQFDENGTLLFSSFFGGSNYDYGRAIAIDKHDNILISGGTHSTDFPILNGFDHELNDQESNGDGFITKLASNYSMIWSTYIGGEQAESIESMVIDSDDNVLITGYTDSVDYPTYNGHDTTYNNEYDMFLSKITSNGAMVFSTYLGGSGTDYAKDVTVDKQNNIIVLGETLSPDFETLFPFNSTKNGDRDITISQFDKDGTFLFSSYFGGSDDDSAGRIRLSHNNTFVLVGTTQSDDFPILDSYDTSPNGDKDIFFARLPNLRYYTPQISFDIVDHDTVNIEYSNMGTTSIYLDGDNQLNDLSSPFIWTNLSEGTTHNFTILKEINHFIMRNTRIFTAGTPPSIQLSRMNGSVLAVKSTIEIFVSEDNTTIDTVLMNWDHSSNITIGGTYETQVPSDLGIHYLQIYANNSAGMVNCATYMFSIADTPTKSSDSSPPLNSSETQNPGLKVNYPIEGSIILVPLLARIFRKKKK